MQLGAELRVGPRPRSFNERVSGTSTRSRRRAVTASSVSASVVGIGQRTQDRALRPARRRAPAWRSITWARERALSRAARRRCRCDRGLRPTAGPGRGPPGTARPCRRSSARSAPGRHRRARRSRGRSCRGSRGRRTARARRPAAPGAWPDGVAAARCGLARAHARTRSPSNTLGPTADAASSTISSSTSGSSATTTSARARYQQPRDDRVTAHSAAPTANATVYPDSLGSASRRPRSRSGSRRCAADPDGTADGPQHLVQRRGAAGALGRHGGDDQGGHRRKATADADAGERRGHRQVDHETP